MKSKSTSARKSWGGFRVPDESAQHPEEEKGEARQPALAPSAPNIVAETGETDDAEYRAFQRNVRQDRREHKRRKTDQRLGVVGKWLGGGREKAGNIVFIVAMSALVSLVILAMIGFLAGWEDIDGGLMGLTAVVTTCLGYIIGRR